MDSCQSDQDQGEPRQLAEDNKVERVGTTTLQSGGHAVPLFDGPKSRHHRRVPLADLKAEARFYLAEGLDFSATRTLVQFAGFPRSGHSIVGSLLESHAHALVAHELDMMGLLSAGFERDEIFALIARNSRDFEFSGRCWNGFSYAVPGGCGGQADPISVIGDKKGDWAVRRTIEDPGLLDRLQDIMSGLRVCWISVIRNPFDNVATLSLRNGRQYDRLRIEAGENQRFRERLAGEMGKSVTQSVLAQMIDDYAVLCAGLEAMKRSTAAEDWYELHLDRLIENPTRELAALFQFLNLEPAPKFVANAANLIAPGPSRTRHDLIWLPGQQARVEGLIARHAFLKGYSFDD